MALHFGGFDGVLQLPVRAEQTAAVGVDATAAAHEAEFHREPEETRHGFDHADEAAVALVRIAGLAGKAGGGVSAIAEADEDVREVTVGVHRNVAGYVVEDIGFRQVVHAVRRTDRDGGGELAAVEAIEEQKRRHIPTDRLGLKAGKGFQAAIDIGKARYAIFRELESVDAAQKMAVGVALPAGLHPRVQASPGLVIIFRVQLIRLRDVQLAAMAGFLHKRGASRGQSRFCGSLQHGILPLISKYTLWSAMTTTIKWCLWLQPHTRT